LVCWKTSFYSDWLIIVRGPNDEQAQDHLDIAHHLFTLAFDGKLCLAPLSSNVSHVLDIGTGTGIWAIDFADEHSSAAVLGTDLSPIQPTWVPPNLKFEIDDCEAEWAYPDNHFDYIHIRSLFGCVKDWHRLYAQAMR
jgi:SAM-dependent methyltransferase